ncbi:MAG: 5'-nucleotidase, lipoprotein e(P4) family [Flavobacteriales bacterium]|jgi:5'-nucleotidase (lipoprotein e(P4) family)|nr:5'-nucleotidase, lipoprotein e(P4) family [Flavobacteriales bacterium]
MNAHLNPWLLLSAAVPFTALISCSGRKPIGASTNHESLLAQQGTDAVIWQHASAEAHWLYVQGYDHATWKLESSLAAIDADKQMVDSMEWDRRPLAVIVDIDETVLDNSPYQVSAIKHDRTFDQSAWREWTDKASAKASPGALGFLQYAKSAGCEVFYITNRDIREKASTLKNLQDLGFPDADEKHLLLMEGTSDKTERRARVKASHQVLLLVGDQLRDFDERFKDRSVNNGLDQLKDLHDSLSQYFILLPNPMYGTWRDAIQGKGTDAEKHARVKAWFEKNGY